jgi:hypothetical protein
MFQRPSTITVSLLHQLTMNTCACRRCAAAITQDEIGVAVVLDVDGKLATLDGGDLTGYGISKPIKLGGQVQRTEAIITVQVSSSILHTCIT